MIDLKVKIAGLSLEHPVMNASGILGYEPEHVDRLVEDGFSAIVTKTFTIEPRLGYPPPVIIELESGGWLNAVGLANPGIQKVGEIVRRARIYGKPVIVSIAGSSESEFAKASEIAEESGADALELNLSCPHVRGHGIQIGSEPDLVFRVVKAVTSIVRIPVIAKLGLCDRVVVSAEKALEAGASALTLINTIKAMSIDVYSLKPVLSNKYGGLSGPPIKPIAVRVVYEVYGELGAEIIGCGGISSWKDVAEMISAGARAVQIGTAYAKNKRVVSEVLSGLKNWLQLIEYKSLQEVIGVAHKS